MVDIIGSKVINSVSFGVITRRDAALKSHQKKPYKAAYVSCFNSIYEKKLLPFILSFHSLLRKVSFRLGHGRITQN